LGGCGSAIYFQDQKGDIGMPYAQFGAIKLVCGSDAGCAW
jgi:hypothetical protein